MEAASTTRLPASLQTTNEVSHKTKTLHDDFNRWSHSRLESGLLHICSDCFLPKLSGAGGEREGKTFDQGKAPTREWHLLRPTVGAQHLSLTTMTSVWPFLGGRVAWSFFHQRSILTRNIVDAGLYCYGTTIISCICICVTVSTDTLTFSHHQRLGRHSAVHRMMFLSVSFPICISLLHPFGHFPLYSHLRIL